jgi:hypothetical protein
MARSISRVVLWCGLLTLMAAAEGCQRRQTWTLAPVEGTVTKDGHPLAGILVVFWVDVEAGMRGPRASGVTDEAGHYRLRTDVGDGGAAIGHYRVCIIDPQAKPETPVEKRRVPPRYGSFTETPLRVEVHPGPQTLNFDLP